MHSNGRSMRVYEVKRVQWSVFNLRVQLHDLGLAQGLCGWQAVILHAGPTQTVRCLKDTACAPRQHQDQPADGCLAHEDLGMRTVLVVCSTQCHKVYRHLLGELSTTLWPGESIPAGLPCKCLRILGGKGIQTTPGVSFSVSV